MRLCCIIKPASLPQAAIIIRALEGEGIPLLSQREVIYSDSVIRTLYDHMPEDALFAIKGRMEGGIGLALLVEAESIEKLLAVVGRESDPARCAPMSLRARFGKGAPEEQVGTWAWFENAIHRPVDAREALRDLSLLFSL